MFDDLAAYYQENVVASFSEYKETAKNGVSGRSRDLKGAVEAASALFHLREHLPDPKPSRREIEIQCNDYGLLGDIVNAVKHNNITGRTPHGAPLVDKAQCLSEQVLLIAHEDSEGTYKHVEKTVVVKLTDGSERNLLDILTNVANFWENHMVAIGIKSTAHPFLFEDPLRYRSREECEEGLGLELIKGLRFKQTIKMMRYNNEAGVAEPVDLAGSQIKMSMYRPKYDVDIVLRNDATGQEMKTTISLSEEESEEVLKLKTDREKQEYVYSLPKAKDALMEMAAQAENNE